MRACILVAQGFQDEEFVYPYYRMLEEGWNVEVMGPECTGKYGIPSRSTHVYQQTDVYDLVIIPGGYECPDRLRMNETVLRFVKSMFMEKKLVAAICHGPWVCISAGIVHGMLVTGYPSIKDDLTNAGGHYTNHPVVIDKNLITAQHYKHNGEFMASVIEWVNNSMQTSDAKRAFNRS